MTSPWNGRLTSRNRAAGALECGSEAAAFARPCSGVRGVQAQQGGSWLRQHRGGATALQAASRREGITGHQFTNGINLIEKPVCGIGAVACDIKPDVDEIALGLGTSLDFSQRV
jgi:hypothetical protein